MPEAEPQQYERHRAEVEPVTTDVAINSHLERRAAGLEEIVQKTPKDTPLLRETLKHVQKRADDPRSLIKADRLPIPEKYQTSEMNKTVGELADKLLFSGEDAPTLATLMMETMSGRTVEERDTVKALGLRILQAYAPEHEGEQWRSENFGEGRRQRVRLGEMLIVSGQLGDMSADMRDSDLGKLDEKKAQAYYERFTKYAHNHDVPSTFRKNLLEATAFLESQHPSLAEKAKAHQVQPFSEKERQYIETKNTAVLTDKYTAEQQERKKSERAQAEAAQQNPVVEDSFEVAVAEGIALAEQKDAERAQEVAAAHERATRSLAAPAEDVAYMEKPGLEARLAGLTTNRATSAEREQAREWLTRWREGGKDLGASTLRLVIDRYSAPTPEREQRRQRYLNVMQNELGRLDTEREGGALNRLTSNWIEKLYARVAINPSKPWRWAGRRGHEDIMQARADVIESLRAGVRDQENSVNAGTQGLLLELSERYEELQARDQLVAGPSPERAAAGFFEKRQAATKRAEKRAVAVERQRVERATTEPSVSAPTDGFSAEDAAERYEADSAEYKKAQRDLVARELRQASRPWWKRLFGRS